MTITTQFIQLHFHPHHLDDKRQIIQFTCHKEHIIHLVLFCQQFPQNQPFIQAMEAMTLHIPHIQAFSVVIYRLLIQLGWLRHRFGGGMCIQQAIRLQLIAQTRIESLT